MTHRLPILLFVLFLLALHLALFGRVRDFDFIRNYDDDIFIIENPHIADGLTAEGATWAFGADLLFDSPHADYWQPATMLSRMLDVAWYGLDPAGHHNTNLLIHTLNSVLLFLVLFKSTKAFWPSGFVAVFFAVHPVQASTVAWVTARKDLLAVFFGLLAIYAYVYYAKRPSVRRMGAVALAFACSLMAKPSLILLPFLFLLFDVRPLERIGFGRGVLSRIGPLIVEKGPCFLVMLMSAAIVRFGSSGVIKSAIDGAHVLITPVHYLRYVSMLLWPHRLSVRYPLEDAPQLAAALGAAAVLVVVTAAAFRFIRSSFAAAGWLWLLIMLAPIAAMGIENRFVYFPMIGVGIVLAWAGAAFFFRFHIPKVAAGILMAAVLSAAAYRTHSELGFWQNNLTLFRRAVAVTKDNARAQWHLAEALVERGDIEGARAELEEAVRLAPDSSMPYNNLGVFSWMEGRPEDAVRYFREAVRRAPHDALAQNNLARSLTMVGKYKEAVPYYEEAIRLRPDFTDAHIYLADNLKRMQGTS